MRIDVRRGWDPPDSPTGAVVIAHDAEERPLSEFTQSTGAGRRHAGDRPAETQELRENGGPALRADPRLRPEGLGRYDDRMRRITITIPDETLERVRGAVADGAAPSVSAYLSTLADEGACEADLLRIVDALDAEMGAPSQEDIAWAKSVVEPAA